MDKPNMSEYTLTVEDVAKELGITPGRIRQLIVDGRIVGIMRAGAWFFKPDVVESYTPRRRRKAKQ